MASAIMAPPRRLTTRTAGQVGLKGAGDDLRLVRSERQRRARERLSGHPRQRQPEHRTPASLAPRLQPAAVQPGILERDGQPETGPPGGPGPRRVRAPEPLEDQLVLAGTQADAMITHRD